MSFGRPLGSLGLPLGSPELPPWYLKSLTPIGPGLPGPAQAVQVSTLDPPLSAASLLGPILASKKISGHHFEAQTVPKRCPQGFCFQQPFGKTALRPYNTARRNARKRLNNKRSKDQKNKRPKKQKADSPKYQNTKDQRPKDQKTKMQKTKRPNTPSITIPKGQKTKIPSPKDQIGIT